jgi:hypothetical protein
MLRNSAIALAAILVGALLSTLMSGSLNGHGPEAGFLGMALVFILGPILAGISAVGALITNGRSPAIYFNALSVAALSFSLTSLLSLG